MGLSFPTLEGLGVGLSFPTEEGLGVGFPSPFGDELGVRITPLAMLTAKQSIASATDSSNMSKKLIMPAHLFFQHAKIQKNNGNHIEFDLNFILIRNREKHFPLFSLTSCMQLFYFKL